jgi:hypothetical protein
MWGVSGPKTDWLKILVPPISPANWTELERGG